MIVVYRKNINGYEFDEYDGCEMQGHGQTEFKRDGKSIWFEDMGDGRLIDESGDTWFELNIEGLNLDDLINSSVEFREALASYILETPDLMNKVKAFDNISLQNSKNGKRGAANMTPEQRTERARKAAQARHRKK